MLVDLDNNKMNGKNKEQKNNNHQNNSHFSCVAHTCVLCAGNYIPILSNTCDSLGVVMKPVVFYVK